MCPRERPKKPRRAPSFGEPFSSGLSCLHLWGFGRNGDATDSVQGAGRKYFGREFDGAAFVRLAIRAMIF
jgi:hypothetical protein